MNCTRCGQEIQGDPVMVIYGDPALQGKLQTPFALDQDCYESNKRVKVAEWRNKEPDEDGNVEVELVEFTITRYKKA